MRPHLLWQAAPVHICRGRGRAVKQQPPRRLGVRRRPPLGPLRLPLPLWRDKQESWDRHG
jgi:hypothetical protein